MATMLSPLVLVAALALSQTVPADSGRSVAVVPATSPLGQQLEEQVRLALTAARVPLQPASALREQEALQCENNKLCLALLGRVLGTFAVARVETAVVGADVALLVEVIESATGKVIREESFVTPAASLDVEVPPRLAPLAAELFAILPAPRPVAMARVEPKVENPALDLTAPAVQPRSSFPIWVTGTGAVVFAGASAGLLAVGASARNCLHGSPINGRPTVCVPQAQAASMQQRADLGVVTGTAAAAVAIGLTVTAIVQHLIAN